MTTVVVDASAAIGWLVRSQRTATGLAFLAASSNLEFTAPFVFDWEVKNVLLALGRSGRLTSRERDDLLRQFDDFAIDLQPPISPSDLVPLAVQEGLSLLDAAYLEAALSLDAPLASRDGALLAAASQRSVETFDLSGDAP